MHRPRKLCKISGFLSLPDANKYICAYMHVNLLGYVEGNDEMRFNKVNSLHVYLKMKLLIAKQPCIGLQLYIPLAFLEDYFVCIVGRQTLTRKPTYISYSRTSVSGSFNCGNLHHKQTAV